MTGDLGPGRPHEHEVYDELAVGWALHALEPEDEAAFADHLAGCARCTRTVAETHDVMAAMSTDLPVADPSPSLRDRLMAAVDETEQVHRPGEAAEPPVASAPSDDEVARLLQRAAAQMPPRRGSWSAAGPVRPAWRRVLPNALVAAAVAAVLALGTWNVLLVGDRDQARQVAAEQADVMKSLLTPGQATIAPMSDTDGHTVATVVARDGQVQVVAEGMPPNDAQHTYVVWGMTAAEPVPLGTFDVVTSQLDLRTVGSEATGLAGYSAYGISLEQGHQPPPAPTDIVATGQVSS